MFQRLRHLEISLAAKCQLMFGAAVILIIAAALFVPWQRMEQLTEKINERAAATLAEALIQQHVQRTAMSRGYTATTRSVEGFALPRLMGIAAAGRNDGLTKF